MSTWMDAPTLSSSSSSSSASPSSLAKGFAMNATSAVIDSMVNHSSSSSSTSPGVAEGAKFNPSMAIIIVVLLGTFFFMGFLSIYVKKCVTTEGDMEHYHFPMSWTNDHSAGGRWHQQQHPQQHQAQHFLQHRQQPQGLDKAAIQALPIVGFTKSKECCVCLGEFQENECLRLLPRCGHTFHVECIDMWLVSHTTCPLCRFKLTPDNVLSDCAALEQQQQQESFYQQQPSARNVDHALPPEPSSRVIVLLPDYGDHQLGALQQVIEAPNFEPQLEETSISIPPASSSSSFSSPSSSDQSSSHDLEQGIPIQETQQQGPECGNEEHNLPRLLLLKVWKALRCWRTGMRTRIVGNSIFLASSSTTTASSTTGRTPPPSSASASTS